MEGAQQKIFIVDDDEFILDMYVLKFRDSGFDVEIAKSGEEALEKIRNGYTPDAMLLDIVMPEVDGLEVLRTIKKETLIPNTVFIILSNLGQKEDISTGMDLGAHDYIVKAHFTPTEVVNKVKSLLKAKI